MRKILGVDYVSDKEAGAMFGYSAEWFQKRRREKLPPTYIKMTRRVLYPLKELEEWFREYMNQSN